MTAVFSEQVECTLKGPTSYMHFQYERSFSGTLMEEKTKETELAVGNKEK